MTSSGKKAVFTGGGLGLFFGLLTVVFGFGWALFIFFCGALGALAGWLVFAAVSDRMNVGAAWDALQQEGRRRGPGAQSS